MEGRSLEEVIIEEGLVSIDNESKVGWSQSHNRVGVEL